MVPGVMCPDISQFEYIVPCGCADARLPFQVGPAPLVQKFATRGVSVSVVRSGVITSRYAAGLLQHPFAGTNSLSARGFLVLHRGFQTSNLPCGPCSNAGAAPSGQGFDVTRLRKSTAHGLEFSLVGLNDDIDPRSTR